MEARDYFWIKRFRIRSDIGEIAYREITRYENLSHWRWWICWAIFNRKLKNKCPVILSLLYCQEKIELSGNRGGRARHF